MGVVSRRWVWLVGVVVRRYIDFLIILIPTPPCICSFLQQHPYFLFIIKMFFILYIYIYSDLEQVNNLNCNSSTFFVPNSNYFF